MEAFPSGQPSRSNFRSCDYKANATSISNVRLTTGLLKQLRLSHTLTYLTTLHTFGWVGESRGGG
jgi:hypothetical protein